MARIRSIKPEFWKSETIASLPFRDRLTFIGLWSYVDDNGVGADSFKLISAELFGLEDDPREVRDNTRECLARLANAGLIVRYTLDGKRYIRITNWDEHQRIDRPNKPRYPLPASDGVEMLDMAHAAEMDLGTAPGAADSRNTRATLASVHRLEQWSSGAGEQGNRGAEEETHSAPAEFVDEPPAPVASTRPPIARFDELWPIYPLHDGEAEARKAWINAIKRATPDEIIAGAVRYRDWPRRDPNFTKKLANWLANDCWKDPMVAAVPPANRVMPGTQQLTEVNGLMLGPRNIANLDRAERMAALDQQRNATQATAIEGAKP